MEKKKCYRIVTNLSHSCATLKSIKKLFGVVAQITWAFFKKVQRNLLIEVDFFFIFV